MKKIIAIACLPFVYSCGNNVPKCDNPEVIKTAKALIVESDDRELYGIDINMTKDSIDKNGLAGWAELMDKRKEKLQLSSIITNEVNEELKSCGCEATIGNIKPYEINFQGDFLKNGDVIHYNVKTDSNGEVLVEVLPF